MKRNFKVIIMLFIAFLVGCQTSTPIDLSKLESYEVKQTNDENTQGEFIFRLISEKAEYQEGEKVNVYGELEYVGDKPEISIYHSSSVFTFPLEEKLRGYHISAGVNDIGLTTTIKQGEVYREDYVKGGGFMLEEDSKDYVKFMEDFLDRDDFPAGYYVVTGYADFAAVSGEDSEEKERFELKTTIDFKVAEQ